MTDSPNSPDFRGIPEDDDVEANGGAVRWTPSKSIMPAAEQRVREIEEAVAGSALEEPDADVKARMAKLNEAAELRIVIARARAKTRATGRWPTRSESSSSSWASRRRAAVANREERRRRGAA